MSVEEIFVLAVLIAAVSEVLGRAIWSKDALDVWQPLTAIALYFAFYTVLGPLVALWTDNTIYAGRDFRPEYATCWFASLVAFLSMRLGYSGLPSTVFARLGGVKLGRDDVNRFAVRRYAALLFLIGFSGGAIWAVVSNATLTLPLIGLQIGAGRDLYAEYDPSRVNYFYHLINALTPAILITYLTNYRENPDFALTTFVTLCALFLVLSLYASVGFRYRLLILLVGLYVAYHLKNKKMPSVLGGIALLAGFISLMSVIAITRSYYSGLELRALSTAQWDDILEGAIRDSNTFFALGGILDAIPDRIGYFYFEPIYYVFILPIPKVLWATKPLPEYLGAIAPAIGTFEAETAGSAVPNFGEFYMGFGWVGLFIGSVIFGFVCRFVWEYFKPRLSASSTHRAMYSIVFPFVIYAISRGYLAQIVQDFVFFFVPLLFVRKLAASSRRRAGVSAEQTR
jgi:hypothetical protein